MADPVKRTLEQLRTAGAPSFFERDPSVLKAKFKAEFERISGRILYPAQTEMFLIEVAAYALAVLHESAQIATLQNTAVFAEGVHLENRGANVSTFRLLPQPARTTLQFSLTAARETSVVVPKGTRVASGNAVVFATEADLVIPPGIVSGAVSAVALEPGARWNGLSVGAVTSILDPIAYVSSASNVVEVSGGTDIEDEERFRLRVVNALFTIAKTGPKNGYREHVMAVDPEIVDVAVIRPEPGHIHIYPLTRTGQPTDALKTAVLDYLDPETRRPMGDDVTVLSPEPVPFALVLTVRTEEAIAGIQTGAEEAARKAFSAWTLELGCQVAPSVIIAAVKALTGVTDVSVAGIEFRDLAQHQYAVLSELTVKVLVTANG